tara:strand:+ start:4315 stop:4881 length:567 start_codon:yes stop_codon:yes gene_type:complete
MIDIFKTSIHTQKININNKQLLEYILNLKKKTKGKTVSSPTGWQSFDLNMKETIFSQLNKEIDNNFSKYIKESSLKNEFKIANMWANVNSYKDYNLTHTHGNAVVSGVYYIKVPKNSGNIFFVNPAANLMEICWKDCIDKYTEQNSPMFLINSIESYLVLFPSWLEHGVNPNLNKKENRVSLSFNITK